jgi:NitT/TauT family transport system ATP-binding protein
MTASRPMELGVASDRSAEGMIVATDVAKVFAPASGKEVTAVSECSFSIADGEFVTVLGPSGCGKSTLLRMVAGLTKPSSGQILVDGEPVTGPNTKLGIVFQHAVLLKWRTVLENVMLPAEILGRDKSAYREKARALLELAGLGGFENHMPNELSGGMQQRAALCRTLAFDPKVLLMDEPFGALDALTREELSLELLRIWDENRKTVMFVTHNIAEAVLLGDRVFVMTPRPGRLAEVIEVDIRRPRDITDEYSDEFQRVAERCRELLGVGRGRRAA